MSNKNVGLGLLGSILSVVLIMVFEGGAITTSTAESLYGISAIVGFVFMIWAIIKLVKSDE
jgi:hypothetical protein